MKPQDPSDDYTHIALWLPVASRQYAMRTSLIYRKWREKRNTFLTRLLITLHISLTKFVARISKNKTKMFGYLYT